MDLTYHLNSTPETIKSSSEIFCLFGENKLYLTESRVLCLEGRKDGLYSFFGKVSVYLIDNHLYILDREQVPDKKRGLIEEVDQRV